MTVDRRFLIARSLARLVCKERGTAGRAVEGYFAAQADRTHFVSIEPGHCHLVLATRSPQGVATEERTEVPRAQAEALLDVCAGKIAYDRSQVQAGGREAFLDRFMTPGPFDLLTVSFENRAEADGFAAPAWFGPEVTDDPAYEKRSAALKGVPESQEVPLSNAGLDALLDALEGRAAEAEPAARPAARGPNGAGRSPADARVSDAFRRLAAATQEPQAAPAEARRAEPDGPGVNRAAVPAVGESRMPVAEDDAEAARIDHLMEGFSQALGRPEWSEGEPQRPSVVEIERFGGRVRHGQR